VSPALSVTPPVHPTLPLRSTLGSLLSRYRSGTRGYMKAVVLDLLRRYLQVETQFQHGEGLGGVSRGVCGAVWGVCGAHHALPRSSL